MLNSSRSNSLQRNVARALLLAVVWVLVSAPTAFATTRYVSTTGSNFSGSYPNYNCLTPCRTIGWAIENAVSGDFISVAKGTYVENITVSKNLTIQGEAIPSFFFLGDWTTVDGGTQGPVFKIDPGVNATIARLYIANGIYGLYNQGTLTVIDVVQYGAHGSWYFYGDGIRNEDDGAVSLDRVWLAGNDWYGLANLGSKVNKSKLKNVKISGNGSGIFNGGLRSIEVSKSAIYKNKTVGGLNEGTLTMWNVTITGSEIGLVVSDGIAYLLYTTVTANSPEGGIHVVTAGVVDISDSIVAKNTDVYAPTEQCSSNLAASPFKDEGYNVFGDDSCLGAAGAAAGTLASVDPHSTRSEVMSSFFFLTGFTLTHALQSGSPAIDRVPPGIWCPPNDQRGVHRPIDGPDADSTAQCDAGAYEYKP